MRKPPWSFGQAPILTSISPFNFPWDDVMVKKHDPVSQRLKEFHLFCFIMFQLFTFSNPRFLMTAHFNIPDVLWDILSEVSLNLALIYPMCMYPIYREYNVIVIQIFGWEQAGQAHWGLRVWKSKHPPNYRCPQRLWLQEDIWIIQIYSALFWLASQL